MPASSDRPETMTKAPSPDRRTPGGVVAAVTPPAHYFCGSGSAPSAHSGLRLCCLRATFTRQRAAPVAPVLSAREREVLNRIACGQSIPAIAAELYVAPSTVKTHVQRLYEKLGVSDRAAAVAEAMRQRLLD